MKKVFLALCLVAGISWARGYIKERQASQAYEKFQREHPTVDGATSEAGFVPCMSLDGINPYVMTVLMPCGCPLEAGVRGRALVDKMKEANIPVVASDHAGISVSATTQEEMLRKQAMLAKLSTIMEGETPIVFYKGRAKNNPSFEDVQREFASAK
jgi:hypothetical protein